MPGWVVEMSQHSQKSTAVFFAFVTVCCKWIKPTRHLGIDSVWLTALSLNLNQNNTFHPRLCPNNMTALNRFYGVINRRCEVIKLVLASVARGWFRFSLTFVYRVLRPTDSLWCQQFASRPIIPNGWLQSWTWQYFLLLLLWNWIRYENMSNVVC